MTDWHFEPELRMGGASGEAFTHPLSGAGFRHEHILARECIQNSADAHSLTSGTPPKVVFRRVSLKGKEKAEFADRAALNGQLMERSTLLGLQPNNALENLKDQKRPLEIL